MPGWKCVAKRSRTLVILYKLTEDGDAGFTIPVNAPEFGSVGNGKEAFASIVVVYGGAVRGRKRFRV
jgi:hypothetical protein